MKTSTAVPAPQANCLPALACVVDAVADGCATNHAIAEALGYTARQGAYYANAAAGLGLIEASGDSTPREWRLTESGALFVAQDATSRNATLTDALCEDHWLNAYMVDAVALRSLLAADGCDGETVERRYASVESWARFVFATPAHEQVAAISARITNTRMRAPGVRARTKKAKTTQVVRRRYCSVCSIAIPVAKQDCEFCS